MLERSIINRAYALDGNKITNTDLLTTSSERRMVMKKPGRIILIVGMFLMMSHYAAWAAPLEGKPPFSGFLGAPDVYEKLAPGPKDGVKLRWINPNADLTKYNKFMVDSVIFYFANDADYKGIDPERMKELADAFNREILSALKDKYTLVSEPGPGVARLRFAITNVKQSRPVVSTVTTIIPVGAVVSIVKRGVTGGWSGSGETAMEFQALDAATNDVLVMAVDQQKASFTDRFTWYGSATDAFKFWAERIVTFVENTKAVKKEAQK